MIAVPAIESLLFVDTLYPWDHKAINKINDLDHIYLRAIILLKLS